MRFRNTVRIRCLTGVLSLLLAGGEASLWPASASAATATRRHHHTTHYTTSHSRGRVPTIADPAAGDDAQFDDPVIRQIAVEALGHANGSVVAMDPNTGRILSVVNQKMAFSAGFEPCSTIKPVVALAALQEGVITRDSMLPIGRRRYMDLTEAMAHSNNTFFEQVGEKLGFPTVQRYASLLGLGERAGYDIPEEQPGVLPTAPPAYGGVKRMSSFGEGIRITPLQLASLASTLANGGTMYYLQYPRAPQAGQEFTPRVKRHLEISPLLPELREGMLAAVLYGTAKQSYDPEGEQALGKTGTCNDANLGGRLGWFVSYADQEHPKIVLVVLLRGSSHRVSGPHAADIAGRIYHGLREHNYIAVNRPAATSVASATGAGSN